MSETISTITRSSFRVVRVAAMAAIVFASFSVCWLRVTAASHPRDRDWRMIGGSPGNLRYSGLDEINRANVAKLTVALSWSTVWVSVPMLATKSAAPLYTASIV